jgi:anaphase-promoting complex subunit 4
MTTSPLEIFFADSPKEENDCWNHVEQLLPMFELLDKQLQKQEKGLPFMKPLPRVELLCRFLNQQANTVFRQIAEGEKRNVLFGKAHKVGPTESNSPMDMKMSQMVNDLPQESISANFTKGKFSISDSFGVCAKGPN